MAQVGSLSAECASPQGRSKLTQDLAKLNKMFKEVKTGVTGHIENKESWVSAGWLEHAVYLLVSNRELARIYGKDGAYASRALDEEEVVRLQALQLFASFAHGDSLGLLPPRSVC